MGLWHDNDWFSGALAVITGGGDGMGFELALKLVRAGCSVAICDIDQAKCDLARAALVENSAVGATVSSKQCDVTSEAALLGFAAHVDTLHRPAGKRNVIVFANAGVAGGGSMIADSRASWDRVFNTNWHGVYFTVRAFLPMLRAAPSGKVVNIASVNGFYASVGYLRPHTAYSAAKFAVKGFTEALRGDFNLHAPNLTAHLVMPGFVGTGIALNSSALRSSSSSTGQPQDAATLGAAREAAGQIVRKSTAVVQKRLQELLGAKDPAATRLQQLGMLEDRLAPLDKVTDAEIGMAVAARVSRFRESAPTKAEDAAESILNALSSGEWRILVGEDALALDRIVRENPKEAYDRPEMVYNVFEWNGSFKSKI